MLINKINTFLNGTEIVIAHKYRKPPWGGGNQFLMALLQELSSRGVSVGANTFGKRTKYVLVNSHTFSPDVEKKILASSAKIIHRIDGPTSVYGREDNTLDQKIQSWNEKHASKTIFQSQYSFSKHTELGLNFKQSKVIHNAVNPNLFFPSAKSFNPNRKKKLIAAAWSDNPKKGKATFEWLDKNLDFSRFDFTFVGRIQTQFKNIKILPPVGTLEMGALLREADVYIFASQFDSCSNSLLEALSSGLPAVYHGSGGSPELVGKGGISFNEPEEIPAALDRIVSSLREFQENIKVVPLQKIADEYLDFFYE